MDEIKTAIWLEGFYLGTLARAERLGLPPIRPQDLLVSGCERAGSASEPERDSHLSIPP
jgi:hypothetical protein